jgi:hypothetical protein
VAKLLRGGLSDTSYQSPLLGAIKVLSQWRVELLLRKYRSMSAFFLARKAGSSNRVARVIRRSGSGRSRITRAGLPAAMTFAGKSPVTTDRAPTMVLSPI